MLLSQYMNLILSNYGHKYITENEAALKAPGADFLVALLEQKVIDTAADSQVLQFITDGFIEELPAALDKNQIELHYARNPLEHVYEIVFEITTECNFHCAHCRNGRLIRSY